MNYQRSRRKGSQMQTGVCMRLHAISLVAGLSGILFCQSVLFAQGENLTLQLDGPAGDLRTGEEFEVRVLLDTTIGGIEGFIIGVAHDAAAVEILAGSVGSTTRSFDGGTGPDFLNIDIDPPDGDGATIGVVIDYDVAETLEAGNDYELLKIDYRVLLDPSTTDPCEPLMTSFAFSDDLHPAQSTFVTITGDSIIPATQTGYDATVRCPGSLEITRCDGGVSDVELEWSFSGAPTWDFLFLYRDAEILATLDPNDRSYTDTGVPPGEHDYTLVTFVVPVPEQPELLFSHCATVVNPVTLDRMEPAVRDWIGGDSVSIFGMAFTVPASISLSLFDDGGTIIPLAIDAIVDDTQIDITTPEAPKLGVFDLLVETEFGDVVLEDAFEYGFVRGEVNNDKMVDISDSIAFLEFVILGRGDAPRCDDAADVNDDGMLDITDAVVVLNHIILGTVDIPAPYPEPGQDPTTDDPLGCLD